MASLSGDSALLAFAYARIPIQRTHMAQFLDVRAAGNAGLYFSSLRVLRSSNYKRCPGMCNARMCNSADVMTVLGPWPLADAS